MTELDDLDAALAVIEEMEADKIAASEAKKQAAHAAPKASKAPKAPPREPGLIDVDVEPEPESTGSATPAPTNETEAKVKILSTLPTHAVGGGNVKRSKGRPRTVSKAPTVVDLQYHAEMAAQKIDFIERDPVVQSSHQREDSVSTLRTIKTEIAKEAAALHFQRIENEKFGKDTSQISVRRVDALSKVVAVELELKKLDGDFIDLRSEKFQRVFKFWIKTLEEVAQETLTGEQIDLFFNRLSNRMEGWEERAAEEVKT